MFGNKKIVSFVIPYYNSSRNVENLYNEFEKLLDKKFFLYQVIIIDDASDSVLPIEYINTINKNESFYYERLSHNKGQMYATAFGISKAKGDIIITLDDDLCLSTEFFYLIINKFINNNFDVLYCIREKNSQQSFLREFTGNIIKKIYHTLLNINISSIRVINTKVQAQIISHLNNEKLSIDKIIYSNHNLISKMKIKIDSFGKSRYNIFKLISILVRFIKFKV